MSAEPRGVGAPPVIEAGASLSACGTWRYRLWRVWAPLSPRVTWVMLNPSTADAAADDPTIRKCIGFARRWGCGGIDVVNLFAYRATEPADLVRASRAGTDVVGADHATHLHAALAQAGPVVAAWGAHAARFEPAHARYVTSVLRAAGDVWCLGRSKGNHPRHPLMLAYDTPRVAL